MTLTTLRREHLESEPALLLVRLLQERGDAGPFDVPRSELISRLMQEGGGAEVAAPAAPTAPVEPSPPTPQEWPTERTEYDRFVLGGDYLVSGVDFQVVGEGNAWFHFLKYVWNPSTNSAWIDCYGGTPGELAFRAFAPHRIKVDKDGMMVTRGHVNEYQLAVDRLRAKKAGASL